MRAEELFGALLLGGALFENRFSRASDLFNLLKSGPSCDLDDLLDVSDGGVAVEERIFDDHFGKDAADAPHVHLFIILLRTQQNLWGSVPFCCHSFSQHCAVFLDICLQVPD